ncbi:MAG: hypothetical protein KDJ90_12060 [Nitratireductor sp.]|nr:hypothetical protein [Nitratireductor sp.]
MNTRKVTQADIDTAFHVANLLTLCSVAAASLNEMSPDTPEGGGASPRETARSAIEFALGYSRNMADQTANLIVELQEAQN